MCIWRGGGGEGIRLHLLENCTCEKGEHFPSGRANLNFQRRLLYTVLQGKSKANDSLIL